MEKNIKFAVEDIQEVSFEDYSKDKFMVAKTCFLSTAKNSHGLVISEEILRRDAHTILGNFLVAKMEYGDATVHKSDEVIYGYFPKEQEIEFVEVGEDDDKIVKAYAYAVVSKRYSKDFCGMFIDKDSRRNTSVEFKVTTPEDDESDVKAFDIYGLTCLGRFVSGSCPDADMSMVRFSEDDANKFFTKINSKDKLSQLKEFAKERKQSMAEKTYKKHGLDEPKREEEDKKMSKEIEFAAVNIGDMWSKVYEAIRRHDAWDYSIEGIYEEDSKKFVVLTNRTGDLFRLDFSLTEEGMAVADELIGVQKEFVETDTIVKFAEPEDAEKYKSFEDKPDEDGENGEDDEDDDEEVKKMSEDEMKAELARLQSEIESRDNIIMEKDTELEELRKFRQSVEDKEKAFTVESVMSSIAKFVDKETADKYRTEGMECNFAEIDAWSNKVKASVVDKVVKIPTTNQSFTRMSAPVENTKKTGSVWERL